jgi:Transglycosylase SLT domain
MAVGTPVPEEILRACKDAAEQEQIDPALLGALVEHESGGNRYAIRYEDSYPYLYRPDGKINTFGLCSIATEIAQQRMSWGPAQILGANIRSLGCSYPFLTQLVDEPTAALKYAARFLKARIARYGVRDGLAAYNAGVPTDTARVTYADPIIARMQVIRLALPS